MWLLKEWLDEVPVCRRAGVAVSIVEVLPMNASGKVLKYELRERARKLMEEG